MIGGLFKNQSHIMVVFGWVWPENARYSSYFISRNFHGKVAFVSEENSFLSEADSVRNISEVIHTKLGSGVRGALSEDFGRVVLHDSVRINYKVVIDRGTLDNTLMFLNNVRSTDSFYSYNKNYMDWSSPWKATPDQWKNMPPPGQALTLGTWADKVGEAVLSGDLSNLSMMKSFMCLKHYKHDVKFDEAEKVFDVFEFPDDGGFVF